MTDTTNTPAQAADLENRAAFEADMHAINPGVCQAVLDIYWESTEGKLWRAALGRSAAPRSTNGGDVAEDVVLMPRRLTAENGAKGVLSGEFVESITVTCHECEGVGEVDDGRKCAECDGEGTVEQRVAVEWDTIKRIYGRAVAMFAAQPAEQGAHLTAHQVGVICEGLKLVARNPANAAELATSERLLRYLPGILNASPTAADAVDLPLPSLASAADRVADTMDHAQLQSLSQHQEGGA